MIIFDTAWRQLCLYKCVGLRRRTEVCQKQLNRKSHWKFSYCTRRGETQILVLCSKQRAEKESWDFAGHIFSDMVYLSYIIWSYFSQKWYFHNTSKKTFFVLKPLLKQQPSEEAGWDNRGRGQEGQTTTPEGDVCSVRASPTFPPLNTQLDMFLLKT